MSDQLIMSIISIILSVCATIAMIISHIKNSDGWSLIFIVLEIFAIILAIFVIVQPRFILVTC